MRPQINVITLAVDDLDRAHAFYRDGLGLESMGVLGAEFEGDDVQAAGAVVMFKLEGEVILALYPRTELAKDSRTVVTTSATNASFSLGHIVATRDDVDLVLERAVAAGAAITEDAHDRPWGIYSGYFRDLDGHLWEVIHSPGQAGG